MGNVEEAKISVKKLEENISKIKDKDELLKFIQTY
jgi:hypothetical protein